MRERFSDPNSPAKQLWSWAQTAPFHQAIKAYELWWNDPLITDEDVAELGVLDRYFLLVYLLHRTDAVHPWLYDRCREVELDRDGYLDLWARWHWKSSIGTQAGCIQEILADPEITIGIFSIVRGGAMEFLGQIKQELENNEDLKQLYPEVLWADPASEVSRWSLQRGIVVKRKGNPKEATVEAWGLVDSMPTGKHFSLRIYDDVVTEKSVTTPEMIKKTTDRWELSLSLGHGPRGDREQYFGTRYAFGDTYDTLMKRGAAKPRIYPATDNGKIDGKPVFMSPDEWDKIKRTQSIQTTACQQLLDPREGADTTFKPEWIRVYEVRPLTLNVYIMVDPARTTKKTSDRTAIIVVGMDTAHNKYLLDGSLHRMKLSERWRMIVRFRNKWRRAAGIQKVEVGYERYGAEADFDYFEERMKIDRERFTIKELVWRREGADSHIDRVQRLEPDFREGYFFWPYQGRETRVQREHRAAGMSNLIAQPIKGKDENGSLYNLSQMIIDEEYDYFPVVHVDGLDAMSRFYDMDPTIPIVRSSAELLPAALPAR